MKIGRRDVVNVIFGSNTKNNHLAIVLSPEEVNMPEEQFLGLMITDSTYYDPSNDFSFPLDDTMFIHPLKEKTSRARLYLINLLPQTCAMGKINEMRKDAFERMIRDLNHKIFGI